LAFRWSPSPTWVVMQKVLQQGLSTLLLDDGVALLMATPRASMAVRPWLPNGPLVGDFSLQALPLADGGWLWASWQCRADMASA
jgi:hypothetical protein